MTQFLPRALRHYLLAVQFFTRIPVTGRLAAWVGYSPTKLRASAAHFPGVGWLLGVIQTLLALALLRALPATPQAPLVVAAIVCAVGLMLTGALHEDGLADVADGLGGSYERNRALEIMKDSRVGAFGAIAVAMALLLRVALLAQLAGLGGYLFAVVFFVGHVISRFWPLCTIRLLEHVGDSHGSKSKPLADQITLACLGVGALWSVAAILLFPCLNALGLSQVAMYAGLSAPILSVLLGALLASGLAWLLTWRWFAQRLQGFTGDCLGATQQVCEVAFYLGALLVIGLK